MSWFLARLAEPSTHAGIAAVIGTLSEVLPPPYSIALKFIAAGFGGIAIAKKG